MVIHRYYPTALTPEDKAALVEWDRCRDGVGERRGGGRNSLSPTYDPLPSPPYSPISTIEHPLRSPTLPSTSTSPSIATQTNPTSYFPPQPIPSDSTPRPETLRISSAPAVPPSYTHSIPEIRVQDRAVSVVGLGSHGHTYDSTSSRGAGLTRSLGRTYISPPGVRRGRGRGGGVGAGRPACVNGGNELDRGEEDRRAYQVRPEITFDTFLVPHWSGKGEVFRGEGGERGVLRKKESWRGLGRKRSIGEGILRRVSGEGVLKRGSGEGSLKEEGKGSAEEVEREKQEEKRNSWEGISRISGEGVLRKEQEKFKEKGVWKKEGRASMEETGREKGFLRKEKKKIGEGREKEVLRKEGKASLEGQDRRSWEGGEGKLKKKGELHVRGASVHSEVGYLSMGEGD